MSTELHFHNNADVEGKWHIKFQMIPKTACNLASYLYAKQKFVGCKKGEANEKQQLSAFSYMTTCDQIFDIKFRPRIS